MKFGTIRLAATSVIALALASCSGTAPLTPLPPAPPPSGSGSAPASSSAAWTPAPDAPFRQSAPEPGPQPAWTAPVPTEHRLSNGIRVLYVQRTQLPIAVVQVVSRRGADQQSSPGVGSFMGRMLEQGTKTRTALQVSDDYEAIGAQHGAWVTWDSSNVWMKVLPSQLQRGVEILADVVQNPAFSQEEIDRARSQQLATWRQMLDSPQSLLSRMVVRSLFPNHGYGSILLGDEDAIKRIKRQDIVSFYDKTMVPSDTAIVVVGNVERDATLATLEKAFGGWKRAGVAAVKVRKPGAVARSIVLVDQPGAPQSNIAVAGVGAERTAPDYDAIQVANTIFGGMFSSRLNLNLREKHAFTYGAWSTFDMRRGTGPFYAGAAVDTPNTGAALREIIGELQGFCSANAKPEELNLALGQLVKSMPGDFEGASATASQIASLWVYGLPLDEYRVIADRLAKVTPDDVLRVSATRMSVSNTVLVVVGDRKAVQPQLEALQFGPIRVVDKQGKVVETVGGKGGYTGYACKAPLPEPRAATPVPPPSQGAPKTPAAAASPATKPPAAAPAKKPTR